MFFRSRVFAGLLMVGVCGGPAFAVNSCWYEEVSTLAGGAIELSFEPNCRNSESEDEVAAIKHETSEAVFALGAPCQFTLDVDASAAASALARVPRTSLAGVFSLRASEEAALETEVFGLGHVLSVNRAERVVTLRHRAVQEYGWHAGERSFVVAASVAMDLVPADSEVFFGLAQAVDGTFIITAIFE